MGKKALSWIFVCFLGASIYIFASKDDKDLRESVKAIPASVPRVTLKNFEIRKYSDSQVKMSSKAKLAYFIEPDTLEVYGNIVVNDYTKSEPRFAKGDTLTAYFNTNGLIDLASKAEIKKAILESHVELSNKKTNIYSNIVTYLSQGETISSDRRVSIDSEQGKLYGENGFSYELKDEFLKLFGPVKGLLNGDSIKGISE